MYALYIRNRYDAEFELFSRSGYRYIDILPTFLCPEGPFFVSFSCECNVSKQASGGILILLCLVSNEPHEREIV